MEKYVNVNSQLWAIFHLNGMMCTRSRVTGFGYKKLKTKHQFRPHCLRWDEDDNADPIIRCVDAMSQHDFIGFLDEVESQQLLRHIPIESGESEAESMELDEASERLYDYIANDIVWMNSENPEAGGPRVTAIGM